MKAELLGFHPALSDLLGSSEEAMLLRSSTFEKWREGSVSRVLPSESGPQNPCKKPVLVAHACNPSDDDMEGRDRQIPEGFPASQASIACVDKFQANERCCVKTWNTPEEYLRLSSNLYIHTYMCPLDTPMHTQWEREKAAYMQPFLVAGMRVSPQGLGFAHSVLIWWRCLGRCILPGRSLALGWSLEPYSLSPLDTRIQG